MPHSKRPDQCFRITQATQHLSIQTIEPVAPLEQSLLHLCHSKKNGDWRAIVDFKISQQVHQIETFRMETFWSIAVFQQPGEFLMSIHLTKAYLHIPVLPRHRRYVCFYSREDICQFKALSFDLSTALRVFFRVLINPVVKRTGDPHTSLFRLTDPLHPQSVH